MYRHRVEIINSFENISNYHRSFFLLRRPKSTHFFRQRGLVLETCGTCTWWRVFKRTIETCKRDGRSVGRIRSDRAGIKECWEKAYVRASSASSDAQSGSVNAAGGPAAVPVRSVKKPRTPTRTPRWRKRLTYYRSLPISHYHSRHSVSAPSCGIATPRPSPPSFSFHQIFTRL